MHNHIFTKSICKTTKIVNTVYIHNSTFDHILKGKKWKKSIWITTVINKWAWIGLIILVLAVAMCK